MSRYWDDEHTRQTRIARALIVQAYGPNGVDALDYLADQSRADPTEVSPDA